MKLSYYVNIVKISMEYGPMRKIIKKKVIISIIFGNNFSSHFAIEYCVVDMSLSFGEVERGFLPSLGS